MMAQQAWNGSNDTGEGLPLSEVLGALSHALDLTEGQPQGHCMRATWIGWHVGAACGLGEAELADLYFTILLKDLGCSSNAARICELYLADDIGFKRDFKQVDGSLGAALRFVFAQTGLQSGLAERFRAIVNILQNGGDISRSLIETRCHRGADIAAKMRFSSDVQNGILSLDEHWDGSGKPQGLSGEAIPLASRIALLAQVADVFQASRGPQAAMAEIAARSGSWFDPALADAFSRAAADPSMWTALADADFEAKVMALAPARTRHAVDEDYLDEIASAFADIIDAKSPFTAGHSRRVTLYSDMIASQMGLAVAHRRWLGRAALLHDIGKLGVSNQILDKPGRPSEEEWLEIRRHPLLSRQIIERLSPLRSLAQVAGAHHERLDGKGYPDGLSSAEICLETRIMSVADVFDALTADRPYRLAMPVGEALAMMRRDSGTAFDPACLDALQTALGVLGRKAA